MDQKGYAEAAPQSPLYFLLWLPGSLPRSGWGGGCPSNLLEVWVEEGKRGRPRRAFKGGKGFCQRSQELGP